MQDAHYDLAIVGGGLAGGLCALSLAKCRPDLHFALIEPGTIGGNHVWSYFDGDVADQDRDLIEPLAAYSWPAYEVRFPACRRRLTQTYRSITSERLDAAVRAARPANAIIAERAATLSATQVAFESGRTITARAVLDARGGKGEGLLLGWQRFLGQLLEVPAGHGVREPVIMDATVEQRDGYRFVYLLPFDDTHLFVEDTYYSDTPEVDRDTLARRIDDYARSCGWQIASVSREEQGVLPVVMDGDFDLFWPADDRVARAGVRAGLFHQLTSYSLPDAVRFASWLARVASLDGLADATRDRAKEHWRRSRFDRLLTRMLFRAADPAERYRVLQRFYRLPSGLIARFYAGQSTMFDHARILSGKPPVPVSRALRAMWNT